MKRLTKKLLQQFLEHLSKEKIRRFSTFSNGFIIHIKDQRLVIEETKHLQKKEDLKIRL